MGNYNKTVVYHILTHEKQQKSSKGYYHHIA